MSTTEEDLIARVSAGNLEAVAELMELIADQRFRELPGCLAEEEGMQTMRQSIHRLADAGLIRATDA